VGIDRGVRRWLVVVVLFALVIPGGGEVRADRRVWRVEAGDALSVLAERFHVSVDQLRAWNELEDDRILVGQELVVGVEGGASGPTYEVRPGDTLSHVAVRFDMSVEALREMNDLSSDALRVGQELRVGRSDGRNRVDYEVRRGDNLSRIAARHRVDVRDLMRWNRGLRANVLRAGQTIRIWSDVPESVSESVGAPNNGSLEHAERLPPHPGYMIRDRNRAWGTLETVMWIQDAFDAVRAEHSGAPRVRVHDLSNRRGGAMHGHRSHQSGRDADISLYQKRCGGQPCPFRRIRPEHLDARRQWTLLKHWLEEDRIEAVFLDYSLQQPLYEEARRRGASRGQLRRWFQYPRGPRYPLGLVRHFPRHRDHIHVRFVCPDTDERCR